MRVPLIEIDLRMPLQGIRFDRVLFLDIDGVLHPDGPGDYDDFACLPLFCEALQAADPDGRLPIVVSSAWRHTQRLDAIKGNFPQRVRAQIVGVTPSLADVDAIAKHSSPPDPPGAVSARYQRQNEITAWIHRNAPKARWLAVDDRASGFADTCPDLFLVPGFTEGGGGPGITAAVAIDLQKRLQWFLQ